LQQFGKLGSLLPFAANAMKVRFGLEADLTNITLNGNLVRRTGLGAGCGQFAQSCHLMDREE
jgi:hypothetical protein